MHRQVHNTLSDVVFFYTKSESYKWNNAYKEYSAEFIKEKFRPDENGRLFRDFDLGDYSEISIAEFEEKGRIYLTKSGNRRLIRYLDEEKGEALGDIWSDIPEVNSQAQERAEYSTQKPEMLLQRIIKASSNATRDDGKTPMIVADFFGGSGVTAKVAHDLKRRFIHVDVGLNSIQTTRDRLQAAGASFRVLDIQDGVSLFRNPVQTMDKLKTLIVGLKNEDGLDKFWEGAIQDSKLGLVPVYLPNLLDHQTKVLDVPLINRVLNEALPDVPDGTKQVIVYYVDIFDRPAVEKFIKTENMTGVAVELRDLKEVLGDVVLNDIVQVEVRAQTGENGENAGVVVEIKNFASDRLQMKIRDYNTKKGLTGKSKTSPQLEIMAAETEADDETETAPRPSKPAAAFKPIQISDTGLELIEWVSLDCSHADGPWTADVELKIDKKGMVIKNGTKTKTFWDATIAAPFPLPRPLRLKVRNIAGDESILPLPPAPSVTIAP